MLSAAGQMLTDDEHLALMKAIKSRWASDHERGQDGGGDGGQPMAR